MLKVLVLGSNSFIGKHLIQHLAQTNKVALSVFGRKSVAPSAPNIKSFSGDFADAESLKKALDGQDVVYHFISNTIPSTSWDNPNLEVEKNLLPTLKLIELAAEGGVKKIAFASSGGTVYGLQQNLLTEQSLTEPFSPYGIVKRTIESFLQYAKFKNQLNYDIYRISNVYGEGQNIGKGLGFINTALENIVNNHTVSIYGDGENVRDYIYVNDVAKLLRLSLTKDFADSDIYNVSSNYPISLNDLLASIKNVVGFDFKVEYLAGRQSDNRQVVLDNAKIMQYFPKMQLISLADGIKNTFEFLKNRMNYVEKSV